MVLEVTLLLCRAKTFGVDIANVINKKVYITKSRLYMGHYPTYFVKTNFNEETDVLIQEI
jgi:hypothetical protein